MATPTPPTPPKKSHPLAIVGRSVVVRTHDVEPPYFTERHRFRVGSRGVVHAIVARGDQQPLVKIKFADDRIVFFALADLDVRDDEPAQQPKKHGARASHLP